MKIVEEYRAITWAGCLISEEEAIIGVIRNWPGLGLGIESGRAQGHYDMSEGCSDIVIVAPLRICPVVFETPPLIILRQAY